MPCTEHNKRTRTLCASLAMIVGTRISQVPIERRFATECKIHTNDFSRPHARYYITNPQGVTCGVKNQGKIV